jgi:hypothetical protein
MDLELYRKLDLLIALGNAGSAELLAKKLDLDARQVKHMIDVLKNKYDCPIAFSASQKSYYYTEPGHCVLKFQSSKVEKFLREIESLARKVFD